MKKNLIMLTVVIISASAIFKGAYAQLASQAATEGTNTESATPLSGKALNSITSKAIRDFGQTFKDVTGEQWYSITKGYIVRFVQNSVQLRVDYDRKGNWMSTTRFLSESQMPEDIRKTVKSNFYDCSINRVIEIETGNGKTYIAHLENKTSFKKVSLRNGELEVLEDYNKK